MIFKGGACGFVDIVVDYICVVRPEDTTNRDIMILLFVAFKMSIVSRQRQLTIIIILKKNNTFLQNK